MKNLNAVARYATNNNYEIVGFHSFHHETLKDQAVEPKLQNDLTFIAQMAQSKSVSRITFEMRRPDGSLAKVDF